VPLLFAATVPSLIRMLPVLGGAIGDLLDPAARDRALDGVGASLREVGTALRARAPQAASCSSTTSPCCHRRARPHPHCPTRSRISAGTSRRALPA
jgi:hypothetical protein